MIDIKKLISAYDFLRDEDGRIPVYKMDDAQIDELLDLQGELLEQLPVLIAHRKQQSMIRLKAEKEEESCEVMIKRIFARLDLKDFDCEYGKAKQTFSVKYDIDTEKLAKEYFMPNHASIRAKLLKNESIDWVIPTQKFAWVKVS